MNIKTQEEVRIAIILDGLRRVWLSNLNLRFCQLIENIVSEDIRDRCCIFYVGDDAFLLALDKFVKQHVSNKEEDQKEF